MIVLVVLLALAVALLGVLVAGLLKSHAQILRQLHELGADAGLADPSSGAAAPMRTAAGVAMPRGTSGGAADIVGTDPAGDACNVAVANQQQLTLLAFLSSGCLTCRGFWDAFAHPEDLGLRADIRPVIVTKSPEHEQPALVRDLAPASVTTIMSTDAWDDYDVPVAPYFLLVDGPSGRVIGEGASASWTQVGNLMDQALADTEILDGIRRRPGATGARDRDTDEALLRAGIRPGDPRLYEDPTPPDEAGPAAGGIG